MYNNWEELEEVVKQCRKCRLCETRKNVVFGVGNREADIMFIGEGPGADEDAQGEPFVGKAGKLMNMAFDMLGIKREEVYIANIVKCRPPNNRNPQDDEAENCLDYLRNQVILVKPKIIVLLGSVALKNVLGKEYGKLIPKIREAISKLNQMDLANKVKNGGVEYIEIDGTQIELTSENLLVTMQGKEGFAFAGEGEIGVVLDTTITPELKEEGYVREILSKVQNMRKDKGFEVLDKINLYVSENEMLEELVKKFESEIKKETLTENIVFNTQRDAYTEVSINGEKLMLDVEVVK